MGGLAKSLGLAPATFLGLTIVGWSIAMVSLFVLSAGYFVANNKLKAINAERVKGDLEPVTWRQIIGEVRDYEKESMIAILEKLQNETQGDIVVDRQKEMVVINFREYKIGNLSYVIEKNGREYIASKSKLPFRQVVVYIVKE